MTIPPFETGDTNVSLSNLPRNLEIEICAMLEAKGKLPYTSGLFPSQF